MPGSTCPGGLRRSRDHTHCCGAHVYTQANLYHSANAGAQRHIASADGHPGAHGNTCARHTYPYAIPYARPGCEPTHGLAG